MKAPCHRCEKRNPGCHDSCPEYLAYRDWARNKNRKERETRRSYAFYDEMSRKFGHGEYWKG